MNRYRKRHRLGQWHSIILRAIGFACYCTVMIATPLQRSDYSSSTHLSVSAVTRESDQDNIVPEPSDGQMPGGREIPPILEPRRTLTDADAWVRFEAEYSPAYRSPSLFKREIETAKYDVDTVVFAVDHFVKTIEDRVDFTFENGSLHPTRMTSFAESQNNPRVKLDIDIAEDDKPYFIGVRLIIPVGD